MGDKPAGCVTTKDAGDKLAATAEPPVAPVQPAQPSRKRSRSTGSGVSGADAASAMSGDDTVVVFSVLKVIVACQNRDFEALTQLGDLARKLFSALKVPAKGWRKHLPVWMNKEKVNMSFVYTSS